MTPIEPLQVSEVVERLEAPVSRVRERAGCQNCDDDLKEKAAETIRTLQSENEALRADLDALKLGVLGGEDAPGYAASLSVEQVVQSVMSYERSQRDYAEALRAAGEEAREASLDESAGQGTIALSPDTSEVTGKQFLDRAQRHARSNAHVDVQRLIIDCEALWEASHESELEQAIFELATAIMGRVAPPLEGFIRWPTTAEEAEAMEKIGFAYLKEHAPERLTEAGRAMPSPFPATPDEPGRSEAGVAMSARDVP